MRNVGCKPPHPPEALENRNQPKEQTFYYQTELAFHFLILAPNDIYAVSFTQIHVP